MAKIFAGIVLYLIVGICFAGYGTGTIKRFYVGSDGWVYLGLISQLANTCSCWGEHYKFDAATHGGKNMLSVVMAAKISDKAVNVWYSDSSNPGTDQSNGCNSGSLSILNNIGIP